ncbi:hypothetical protein SAMN05421767_1214 [Granulicatella balaenopterae]|uniref:Exosortase n=1 Tax=Granulicatella balaenopterae TaxID=137733 RepID=A0A1H9LQK2_9LACT|nr:hypothetical protein [Granulicatella balaenopterae]SER13782.1 hypothetical protein SAMN05421767_1214 [Granulicatella balaenopterae]
MSVKQYVKDNLYYLLVIMAVFYLTPLVIQDTGSAMLILLFVMPLVCLVTGFINATQLGFNWLLVVLVFLLFIPDVYFIFRSSDTWIYAIIFAATTLFGSSLGQFIHKK